MAFTIALLKNLYDKMHFKLTIYLISTLLISGICTAENRVLLLGISKNENSFLVAPHLNFNTSEQIKEAIDNGTRINIIVKAHLYKPQSWWFDSTLDNKKTFLEISYFTLSKLYVVKNKETGEQLGFNEYDQLWNEFEKLASFKFNLPSTPNHWVKLRVVLDKGALPTVMQLPVIIDSNWDIDTAWYSQEIKF